MDFNYNVLMHLLPHTNDILKSILGWTTPVSSQYTPYQASVLSY